MTDFTVQSIVGPDRTCTDKAVLAGLDRSPLLKDFRQRWIAGLFAAATLMLSMQPAAAVRRTGAELLDQCGRNVPAAIMACHLYMLGIIDLLRDSPVKSYRACIPADVLIDKPFDVVVDWLTEHATERGQPAVDLVPRALAEAYPCK